MFENFVLKIIFSCRYKFFVKNCLIFEFYIIYFLIILNLGWNEKFIYF